MFVESWKIRKPSHSQWQDIGEIERAPKCLGSGVRQKCGAWCLAGGTTRDEPFVCWNRKTSRQRLLGHWSEPNVPLTEDDAVFDGAVFFEHCRSNCGWRGFHHITIREVDFLPFLLRDT